MTKGEKDGAKMSLSFFIALGIMGELGIGIGVMMGWVSLKALSVIPFVFLAIAAFLGVVYLFFGIWFFIAGLVHNGPKKGLKIFKELIKEKFQKNNN